MVIIILEWSYPHYYYYIIIHIIYIIFTLISSQSTQKNRIQTASHLIWIWIQSDLVCVPACRTFMKPKVSSFLLFFQFFALYFNIASKEPLLQMIFVEENVFKAPKLLLKCILNVDWNRPKFALFFCVVWKGAYVPLKGIF